MATHSDDRIKSLRQWLATHPTDSKARLEMGISLLQRGEYNQAIAALHCALNNPHTHCRALKALCEAYEASSMPKRAAMARAWFTRDCVEWGKQKEGTQR